VRGGPRRQRLKLSIVIPVSNEERFVLGVLRRVAAVPIEKELVVVDDCSRDGSRAVFARIEEDPVRYGLLPPPWPTELRAPDEARAAE
jgi:glycosyltransferase involved in cell wall biosynthesis